MIYVKNNTNQQRIFIPKNEFTFNQDVALQGKDYTITENGEYPIEPDSGYVGISGGTITVEVAASTAETYQEGYEDGEAAQKAKLTSVTLTGNTTVMREDGYSAVTVDVSTAETYQEGFEEGYASGQTDGFQDGEATQKAKLTSTALTANARYTREDGWDEVVVDVQGGTQPILTADTFSANGEYTPGNADGWSAITISVPTSAGTIIPLTSHTSYQYFIAQEGTTYTFVKTPSDNIQTLNITFPVSGETQVTAYFEPDQDGNVKIIDMGAGTSINGVSIDDEPPIGRTETVYMTAGRHKVVYDLKYNDASFVQFQNCVDMVEIDLSDTYATVMPTFSGCEKLRTVVMPRCEEIQRFGCYATQIEYLEYTDFPLLRTIGECAFSANTALQVSNLRVKTVGKLAFAQCSALTYFTLFYTETVENGGLSNTGLEEIEMPSINGVYKIGRHAFANCPISAVTFGSAVSSGEIDYTAFYGCSSLTEFRVTAFINPPAIMSSDTYDYPPPDIWEPTNSPFANIPASGTVTLRSDITQDYIDAWTTWAATYLPGWIVQLES